MEELHLSPDAITANLETQFVGQKVIYFATVPSTMEAARREALWGAPAGTVIITEQQTAARGRMKRKWLSPRGCIALSVILRPNIALVPFMVMIASLAVCRSIEIVTALQPQIKWPNDVLIAGKKVCGILIENDIHRNELRHCIIGIGINVNVHIPDYPEIPPTATSLSDELRKVVSRLDVVQQLLVEMEALYKELPDTTPILKKWQERMVTLGQKVRVTWSDTVYEGVAESVTSDGNLMIRRADGSLAKVVAGDVTLKLG
jgi:BirA family transcriptional regulator, biotin operon repressor / biotin---[acetyl-CoA-carboxylase] ligase